jgi:hypothetical protein
MTEQRFANLNILLQLDYHAKLRFVNLNILSRLDYYDLTIVGEFKYFIKVRLL